jgi:hypothetical protein
MGIAWIASYPKSGNTWVRFLVANAVAGPVESSAQVERLVPDLEKVEDPGPLVSRPGLLLAKTHTLFVRERCRALTERSVYIVRHPKDVLLSNLNYKHLIMRTGRKYSDLEYAREFIELGGDRQWLQLGFGTLEGHIASWLDEHPHPLLLVKYEDLKADTAGQLRTIRDFLGVEATEARVREAVDRSSFAQMRALEVRERAARRPETVFAGGPLVATTRPRYFMHEGGSRRSLRHIDAGLDREFDRRFAPVMEQLGYN